MAIGSNVNPNYPIPGLDQNSKGFRDNFAIIKKELESLQKTSIELHGAINSDPYLIGSSESLVINTSLDINQIPLSGPFNAIQYNKYGKLTGNVGLVFDEGNVTVGIGITVPNPEYCLDVNRSIRVEDEIVINQSNQASSSNLRLTTSNVEAIVSNNDASLVVGTLSNKPTKILTNSIPRITIQGTDVGINTETPNSTLHVVSADTDIATFYTTKSATNNYVKISTGGAGSTIAVGLEHALGNRLGGMRLSQQGTLTLHTNESAGSYLSLASAKLAILTSGKIGIGNVVPNYLLEVSGTFASQGITDTSTSTTHSVGINNRSPQYALDVRGDVATGNAIVSTIQPLIIDTNWLTLDAVPVSKFRSVKYIIQVYNDIGQLDLIECFMSHIDGTPYLTTVSNNQLPAPAANLGSLQTIVDPFDSRFILLQYQGTGIGNRVRIAKTYLLI